MNNENVIPIKEKLSFTDLFSSNKVKQIKWGDKFQAWPVERQLNYAKSLASAMNEAADEMQKDRNRCFDAMKLAEAQMEEAQQASVISKQTMVHAVIDSNKKTRELENEIIILRNRLKAYE